MKTFMACFACNAHQNGAFQGWFENFEVSELEIQLNGPRTTVDSKHGRLHVGRTVVRERGEIEWYGNWCWNSWKLDVKALVKVLAYLHKRGFQMECGEASLFDIWKERPLTLPDILLVTSGLSPGRKS